MGNLASHQDHSPHRPPHQLFANANSFDQGLRNSLSGVPQVSQPAPGHVAGNDFYRSHMNAVRQHQIQMARRAGAGNQWFPPAQPGRNTYNAHARMLSPAEPQLDPLNSNAWTFPLVKPQNDPDSHGAWIFSPEELRKDSNNLDARIFSPEELRNDPTISMLGCPRQQSLGIMQANSMLQRLR